MLALAATALGAACAGGASAQGGCPTIEEFSAYRPPEASRVYAADGSRIADLSHERRVVVELKEVPAGLSNGFVAVEDRRFWEHDGVDLKGVGRALWRNLTSLSLDEGFSTITMQLARNVFAHELPRSAKLRRKVCEIRLAGQIEAKYDKPEILRLYLNQVYMGGGVYGVEAAARAYFGRPASQLTIAESALLIGLVKNPEGYNPRKHMTRAIARRNVVLEVMAQEGVITGSDAESAKDAPITLAPPIEAAGPAPYFVAAVRQELRERFGADADERGLRVHTGLDPELQHVAHDALLAQIRRVEAGEYGRYRHAVPKGDALEPAAGAGSPYLQGMVLLMDTRTGLVRALVGGRDFSHSSYDRAFAARRQPGSAFKPIVYAAAIQHGLTTSTRVATTPVALAGTRVTWRPDDLVDDSVTSLVARDALARSSNYAAVRVGMGVGEHRVIGMARALGLTTSIPAYPSIFLGSAEVAPAEFVSAYATLANGGNRVRPTLIERVEDTRGNVLWRADRPAERAVDEGVAFLTVNMMQDVIDNGTGSAVRRAGFWHTAAGKTGTTNDARDVWFLGVTPDLAAGVWLGFDQPKTILSNATGGSLAAPVWTEVMKAAYADRPAPPPWTPPPGVVTAAVDTETGKLAEPDCPREHVRIEYFLPGTQPLEYCPLHGGGSVLKRLLRGLQRVF